MDYVREELLRQSRALEALMRVDAAEPEDRETEEAAQQKFGGGAGRWERGSASVEMPGAEIRLRTVDFREPLGRREDLIWAEPAGEDAVTFGERVGFGSYRQTGVREVSRAIERDARRYDGGFTMY